MMVLQYHMVNCCQMAWLLHSVVSVGLVCCMSALYMITVWKLSQTHRVDIPIRFTIWQMCFCCHIFLLLNSFLRREDVGRFQHPLVCFVFIFQTFQKNRFVYKSYTLPKCGKAGRVRNQSTSPVFCSDNTEALSFSIHLMYLMTYKRP